MAFPARLLSTAALVVGLAVVNLLRPGDGLAVSAMGKADVTSYVTQGKAMTFVVAEDCRALGLRAGAGVFRGVRVGPASAELRAEVRREAEAIRARFAEPQAVRTLPEVTA